MLTEQQKKAQTGKLCEWCGCRFFRSPGTDVSNFVRRNRFCSVACGNRWMNKRRWMNHVPDLHSRFEAKFIPEPNSGCWLWVGSTIPDGYGYFSVATNKNIGAHRVSWLLYRGSIPDGAHVLHRCDNPPCVNPDHLFLGDHAANVADRVAKGRSYRGKRHAD